MSLLAIRPRSGKGWLVVPIASIDHIDGERGGAGRVVTRDGGHIGWVEREELDDLLCPVISAAPGWYVARDGGPDGSLWLAPVVAWQLEEGTPHPLTPEGRPGNDENWALVVPVEIRTATGFYADVPYGNAFRSESDLARWFREMREAKAVEAAE